MTFQDRDQSSSRVCVGKIASAHGVKGLVKVLPFTDETELLSSVYTSENGSEMLELTIKNPLGKYILAEIKGISDRTKAENLGKPALYVPRETITLTNSSIALIGLTVINEDGVEIGRVRGVENYGASDLLDIILHVGKSVMVPFTPAFVPEVGATVKVVNYEAFLG
jgi:16S rRNA processing protein RimM